MVNSSIFPITTASVSNKNLLSAQSLVTIYIVGIIVVIEIVVIAHR